MSATPKTPIDPQTAEALLGWLDAFPTKALEHRLNVLLTQRRHLDVEIRFLQSQLVRHRQYLEDLRPEKTPQREGAQNSADPRKATDRHQFPPKRMAALRLLSETPGRAWRLADIRTALIQRGWLDDSDRAKHALQVTLLGMAKRGDLDKPRTGFYRLATDEDIASTSTDEPGRPPSRDSVPGELEGGAA